ncbi:outer membrane protein assembly factor BamC [Paucibacter sp. DJ1R-11]|uniref:outer membrane protein assembly factor BamC n=1 Tax=Paucibacter sp. DJ1R-11 TaxID=2893556 RepID=UPI0021E470BE|nr:outer membrane protein assembly factor BamC [Paucibacter sp. DJ1R-11]MCV2364066.1 outer membrane protein assembly factor BamC [Paucibacter sp. DJ1R-11]
MSSVTRSSSFVSSSATPVRLACLLMLGSLAACSTTEGIFSSDKVDYRANARQTAGLDVPPDLTQLARDSRSGNAGGSVSANALQQANAAPKVSASGLSPANTVALNAVGDMRLERNANTRWLRSSLTPEQLWPQLREFWQQRGFELSKDAAEVGVMETNWNENRAKLPQDLIRSTIGKVFDGLYSTGERDMFRTRIERAADGKGTEIFISHRGMIEVYTGPQKDNTAWQPRPNDPQLEAELLSRLMLKLGAKEELAKAAVADVPAAAPGKSTAPTTVITAGRPLSEVPDAIKVSEGFERAWRRVGQSLDRHGFTVEDRDRKLGLFFLRYADPNQAGKEEPNFFERLFSGDKAATSTRYRVSVKSEGEQSTVTVLDDKGQQQTNEIAKRILNLLMDDLR